MKLRFNWIVQLSLVLVLASALTYFIHYLIFRNVHHIFIYMIGDMGFLFLDVLLVIVLIERLLAQREKRSTMKKLNMVIGAFFSEVGLELLEMFSIFIEDSSQLEEKLIIKSDWTPKNFKKAAEAAFRFSYSVKLDKKELIHLKDFLKEKRTFLLRLLENPNLLEHESFTDLLWAVFHLGEELDFRGDKLTQLPESDYNHLMGDLKRAYSQLTREWINYTFHLKDSYPFLFSLAQRINPMNPSASPIISED